MNIVYRGRWYIGDKMTAETYVDSNDRDAMMGLEVIKEDVKAALHPESRFEVTMFVEVGQETVRPEYPMPLVGEDD